MTEGLRHSPLAPAYERLGARVTEFAGWEMPLQFDGVVSEHQAVRERVGVFDVSHLGKLRVRGDGESLQHALTADCLGLKAGHATYSLVLADDGGCIDDVFVYRLSDEEWLVVPNAANVDGVAAAIRDSGGSPADEWAQWAILAIQGPESFELFSRAWPEAGAEQLPLHGFTRMDVLGTEGLVARTGYTGERGFELYAAAEVAVSAFERLLQLGATPVGLGARDTLRLEMGYALYGHELTRAINPLEAGLGWVISWDKDFRGKEALEAIKKAGPARKLVGIRCTDRGVPRQGYGLFHSGEHVGELTSGNFSPTLGTGIGLALVDANHVPPVGERAEIEARGRRIAGDIVKPPFVKR